MPRLPLESNFSGAGRTSQFPSRVDEQSRDVARTVPTSRRTEPACHRRPRRHDLAASGLRTRRRRVSHTAVFINTSAETGAPPGDAVVIAKGEAKTIGRGIARRPDICGICNCVETTAFRAFSATGQAVGVDSLLYLDKDGWHVAAEAGFHWSASEGTTAIRLGEADAIPTAVNSQGLVIGAIADDNEPFIWQAQACGKRLRPVLYPDTQPGDFPIQMRGIGDAGHLLAITLNFQQADGITMTSFFPN